MKFQVYKKQDGTEELRLRPDSERDCDEIEACSQCFFEDECGCEDEYCPDDFMEILHSPQEITFEEVLRKFGFPDSIMEGNCPIGNITVGLFKIENGKVVTDPETMKVMNRLGIIDKIEQSIREEEEEN